MYVSKKLITEALYALELHNKELKQLADSGDAGFWKAEEQEEYKVAQDVIQKLKECLK